jgi:CGNR zinc finger/Putative stress-induced transcription regulator
MPVILDLRNHQFCYTGYVPDSMDLVRLDICGDPADLIVRFLNTLDVDDGTDALSTPTGWQSWLSDQGLGGYFEVDSLGALEQARDLRGDLRSLASGELCAQVRQVDIQVALTTDGQVELGAPTAVGFIAAAAAKVAIEQRLDRVKICPADDCRWAFYDTSRNRSRQWCSMEVCGNRAKARAHRQRSASAELPAALAPLR